MTRVYFDGEARPSARGRMRVCLVVIRGGDVEVVDQPAGWGSSYDAEWQAVTFAAAFSVQQGFEPVTLLGDHKGIVDVINFGASRKEQTLAYKAAFEVAASNLRYTIAHVPRNLNLAGVALDSGPRSAAFRLGCSILEGV